ncbi:DUF87 domain-containing protein [Clostridium sp. VAP23]|uniref:helicase HerA domain-containing protein n=1 Tax=Clostridium sp. VAP23 TaxID=2949981 RepID=UPI002079ACE4|nr:DUF87 domain-containing protein [Clostridium sp. VAP23]
MKKKINYEEKLINFKNSLRSNIAIYEGKTGCGKSFLAKSEISSMEDENIYVLDREGEYKNLSRDNITIINKDKENIFDILDDIYEKSGKLQANKKTIIYIDEFGLYCSDKEKQLKFLDYAERLKYRGISFVLIVQDLDFMDELIRNIYLLYSDEHYEINRD